MDSVINTVVHSNASVTYQSNVVNSETSALLQVAESSSVVELLSDQVSFLLTYDGVVYSVPPPVDKQVAIQNVVATDRPSQTSFSSAVHQSTTLPQRSLKDTIIDAVYVHQARKARQPAFSAPVCLPIRYHEIKHQCLTCW